MIMLHGQIYIGELIQHIVTSYRGLTDRVQEVYHTSDGKVRGSIPALGNHEGNSKGILEKFHKIAVGGTI